MSRSCRGIVPLATIPPTDPASPSIGTGSAIRSENPSRRFAVPAAAAETQTRAIPIRPEIVRRITPVDMNIVCQRLADDQAFDLIIGTNIFIYYGEFEQSLARANVSAMRKPGGFLLTNDKLPAVVASGLQAGEPTVLVVARDPDVTEYLFSYQKTK